MELSQIIPHIEALIFASDKPLTNMDLVELLNNAMGFIEDRATLDQVESAVEGIHEKYSTEFYAFELKQSGGGWQFLTKKQYHKTVAQLNGDKFLKRLSNAALETLAIIAYKQPITKSEIEAIRGVNCDYAVQKLLEKDLVIIAGRNEEAVGKPLIYATSKSFMDYFGINSTDDLPKINEVLMEELVQATIMNNEVGAANGETPGDTILGNEPILEVTEDGEIIESEEPEITAFYEAVAELASEGNTGVAVLPTIVDNNTDEENEINDNAEGAVEESGNEAVALDETGNVESESTTHDDTNAGEGEDNPDNEEEAAEDTAGGTGAKDAIDDGNDLKGKDKDEPAS